MSKEYEKIRSQVSREFKGEIQELKDRNRKYEEEIVRLNKQIKELEGYRTKYAKLVTMSKLNESDIDRLNKALELHQGFRMSDDFVRSMSGDLARSLLSVLR